MESENESDTDEQLRARQNDEFKALKECFSDQLVDLRKLTKVSKNPKKRKRDKIWIPLELSVKIDTHPEPIAGFELHIKCTRKYPLTPPAIGFKNIRGIGRKLISKLHKQLKQEAANEEHQGQGCIALLIMRAQQFLEDHYRDLELNNKSFYDQMVEQKQNCDREAEMTKRYRDELDKVERERQVEEMRQKILRKRELYNESRRRRDSQNSNVENDADESIYDYDGDLDADATTASLTDDGEATTSRLDELEEENEEATIRSRRSTFVGASSRELRLSADQAVETRQSILSRVNSEYEVIEELGHGGFGTVYKVRNRVDSRYYALKKVKLNPDNETLNERILREVKLLSRLNHENVIRYYIAWDEIETQEVSTNKSFSTTGTTNDESAVSPMMNQESCVLSQRDISRSSDDEADDVYCTSYLINDKNVEKIDVGETTANYVVFEESDNRDENEIVESMKKALGPRLSDGESSDDDMDHSHNAAPRLKINRWLYIQMELGQGTLREAIDNGLPKQKDRARRFFLEILDGLCHIHRQGIIHRDLKPVNIFLDSMDRPKIGDFGLATTNLFIVTQNNSPGVHTATAIKPNRMSLEKLRLLASPEQGDSICDINKSGERLKYIYHNHTDNIGTPLYMSPELSATNERTRIAKVIYSHKVDVYSLGIIYFEMLYPFKTGHERVILLQELRKKSINMPHDVENHLSREDIELIRLLLTHDVAARPTTEKLLTSNLLPSVGMREREYQNIIKQVVQNRQARTHKQMLRLLFEQNDSYADDFVFDFEDIDGPSSFVSKNDHQALLRDFNTTMFILDQVKMRMELVLKSRGFVKFVTPILMPKYTASRYYNKQQLDDVVMLMDKNSSILTLPYDLRLPFARTIARSNINYMNRYAIERIYRQRQILGYHPDQLWECCVDIITPPLPSQSQFHFADAEILNLTAEMVKSFPMLMNLKPIIKLNSIEYVKSLILLLNISENVVDDIIRCLAESMNVSMKCSHQFASQTVALFQTTNSLPSNVKDDLRKDLMSSRLFPNITHINSLINLLDIVGSSPMEVLKQLEQANFLGNHVPRRLKDVRRILNSLEETIIYAQGLGLDIPIKFSGGYVLNSLRPVDFYSGMVCMLECKRHSKSKTKSQINKSVILAVGGRYDRLINKFPRDRFEVFDRKHSSSGADTVGERNERENRPKVAVGVSFEVEKFSRFALEDYVDKISNSDQLATPSIIQLIQLNQSLGVSPPMVSLGAGSGPGHSLNPICLRYWPIDVAICSLTHPKPKYFVQVMSSFIRQLRDRGLMCNEILPNELTSFTLTSLMMICSENKIPYMMTVKSQSVDHSTHLDDGNDNSHLLASSPAITTSPSASPTSVRGNYLNSSILATLYRVDKGSFREIRRSDTQAMIDFLLSKK